MRTYQRLAVSLAAAAAAVTACYVREVQPMGPTPRPLLPALAPTPDAGVLPSPQVTQVVIQSDHSGELVAVDEPAEEPDAGAPDAEPPPAPKVAPDLSDAGVAHEDVDRVGVQWANVADQHCENLTLAPSLAMRG